ncbi:CU044_5270 family protein [Sphaerisporangium aureirubrum]|uniref:CU044_5270 family protein n=1 Tax=Sphaerisporangium aureirubrum TaxID=1544736 RepID=A0ABW1N9N4_9ACTN
MNDLDLIRDLRAEMPADPAALAGARARVVAATTLTSPRRRPRSVLPRVALAGALGLSVIAGVTVVRALDDDRVPPHAAWTPAAAVETLAAGATRAAAAEGADMYPRADQWLYIKGLTYQPERGPGSVQTYERWRKGDGTQVAHRHTGGDRAGAPRPAGGGEVVTSALDPSFPPPRWDAAYVRSLPLDPAALSDRLRADREPHPHLPDEVTAFGQIQLLLQEGGPPPRLRAALYTVLSMLRGVALEQNVRSLTGREGVGVYLDHPDGQRQEIIVDPDGYAYLGGRRSDAGGQLIAAWAEVTRGIVDRAGDVP